MSEMKKDIMDSGSYNAGRCRDEFVKEINSHITGACMIPIKLPKKEVINIIERAKKWFYKKYEYSVEKNYYVIHKSSFQTDFYKKHGRIVLPGQRPDGSGKIFSVTSASVMGEQSLTSLGKKDIDESDFSLERMLLGAKGGNSNFSGAGDSLMYYVIGEKFLDMARHVLINKISFEYNRLTRNFKILGETPKKHMVLEVYETIDDCSLFDDEIFFRYVAANVKRDIGRNIMMFDFELPGNFNLSADTIKSDGEEEMRDIEEEIKDDEGTDWFMTS